MIPQIELGAIAPMIAISVGVLVLPLAEVLLSRKKTVLGTPMTAARKGAYLSFMSALVLAVGLILTLNGASTGPRTFNASHPMILMDGVSHFLNAVVLMGALMTVLVSSKYLADVRANHGEFYALVLASVVGMMFLIAASDLMMLFLGLELMSIPVYALAGFQRGSLRSNESALKYFLIGSFASGILLYGCALLYGSTGTIDIAEIGTRFDPENPMMLAGTGMLIIGLAFKISSVPFHQWAPDTYEGAPTTVSAFMATTVKVAAFGSLVRVMALALQPAADVLYPILWVLSVATMTVGNVMAIIQTNTKRMLAYSSIAHAGYLLIGVLVGGASGTAAVMFYLLAYTFMTIGAFTVVAVLAADGREYDNIDDLSGLIHTRPFLAVVMALCMFSLLGIPATAGFMGKWGLFWAAIERGSATADGWLVGLAIIGVLNSAISLVYYLRVPMVMFMNAPKGDTAPQGPGTFEGIVLFACAAAVLLLGLIPQDVFWILEDIDVIGLAEGAASTLGIR